MLTRYNICHDLMTSPYKYKLDGIIYYFSSELHLVKFKEKIDSNRIKINSSLSNRFNINITLNKLCDIMLYKKIETRGFLLLLNNNNYIKCLDNIKLDGEKLMSKNSIEL